MSLVLTGRPRMFPLSLFLNHRKHDFLLPERLGVPSHCSCSDVVMLGEERGSLEPQQQKKEQAQSASTPRQRGHTKQFSYISELRLI